MRGRIRRRWQTSTLQDVVSPHPFLSSEWIAAAGDLRDEYAEHVPEIEMAISVNVTVTNAPFDPDIVWGHIDTTSGRLVAEEGHLDQADLTVELSYDLARSLFLGRDFAAAMQAFFGGYVKVTGDSSKLLQIQPPDPEATDHPLARELARRIDEITEPAS
jgi:hypothetical protein